MCQKCEYEKYIEMMNWMEVDTDFDESAEFISSVNDWVKKHDHITENQKNKINEIYEEGTEL